MGITNMIDMRAVEDQINMGYNAAKKAAAAGKDLGMIPYPNLCPAMAGWSKAIYELFQERQAKNIQWYKSE